MSTSFINKIAGILIVLLIISCKKTDNNTSVNYDQYTFDQTGKNFSFLQPRTVPTNPPQSKYIKLEIPAGAVSEKNYIEYY
ncbi:MAG TPA: hypothetical protein VGF30_07145, partial [Bacteroidia bacterium]